MKSTALAQTTNTQVQEATAHEAAQAPVQNTSFNDFLTSDASNIAEVLAKAADVKSKTAMPVNIAMTYLDLTQGDLKRMIYVGTMGHTVLDEKTNEPKELNGIVLLDENKNFFIYAARQFADTIIERNIPVGTGLEFAWTGVKKTGNGNQLRLHSIKPLID